MIKQKYANKIPEKVTRLVLLVIAVTLTLSVAILPKVYADQFDEQIKALQQQNAQSQAIANQLQAQANSYQEVINNIQAQINVLQAQININKERQSDLQKQIDVAEAELAKQRNILGQNIKAMYLEGQISTLEMLASSKDLSEFVDKEQYRNSVKDKIKASVDRITELKHKLRAQKEEVEKLLKDQENMQAQMAAQRSEQGRLLNLTQEQKFEYDAQIKHNNTQISELKRQQAVENAKLFGSGVTNVSQCGPNYPAYLCNRAMDTLIDDWGMYNRECVSYVAFMVANDGIGGSMPYWGGRGNAWQWGFSGWASYGDRHQTYTSLYSFWHVANASTDNIQYVASGNLQRGDVAVKNGTYGHVMYIESVNSNGTVNISQFNHDWNGNYSEAYNVSTAGLLFLRF